MILNHAKLLDCTLRDGAYLVNKHFGEKNIKGIIAGLVKARIDCIEIGFFQDDGFADGNTVFINSEDAKKYVPPDKKGCLFTVLADCSRYSVENLDECTGESIDAVRECFFKSERYDAIEKCKVIKEKGYKCFVQPVDILGYSDTELLELIELINGVEPYCLSIVDTFGSMYQDDLHRVFELIHHNLINTCKVGFHSHNNMQMSNALSQEFIRMTYGRREVIVDSTISGMGRGAGNTPTELIAQYMVSQRNYSYDMDALLDVIDNYMDNIRSKCSWGYTTPYFVAGCYSAHVNNIAYLTKKNSIRSKDIRYILNKIGAISRKRYDYELLEKTYIDYLASETDDTETMQKLEETISGRDVLLLVPGKTSIEKKEEILDYIAINKPIIIGINFVHPYIKADYIYMSNMRRYNYWKNDPAYICEKKIIASNIKVDSENDLEYIVSFNKLIKCGWAHIDNSTLMVLRLLDIIRVRSINIAGFDGYSFDSTGIKNYANDDLEISETREDPITLNEEIASMLIDYRETRISDAPVSFITESRFSIIFE